MSKEERIYDPKVIPAKELEGKCGVYQIRNLVNGKVYIGSSNNIRERFRTHFGFLRRGQHINRWLQYAYNKYGEDNMIKEVIEFCSLEEQFSIEQYWIDKFFGEECYNLSSNALEPAHKFGSEHPGARKVVCLETRKLYDTITDAALETGAPRTTISECCKNNANSCGGLHWLYKEDFDNLSEEEINLIVYTEGQSIPVICLETKVIYKGAKFAQDELGVDEDGIRLCCNNKANSAGGLHWMFYKDYMNSTKEFIKERMSKIGRSGGPTYSSRSRQVVCLEDRKIFRSIKDAEREYGIDSDFIQIVCANRRRSCFGKHFRYLEDYQTLSEDDISEILSPKVCLSANARKVICLDTNEVFESMTEAGTKFGIGRRQIGSVCTGRRKSTHGLHFKYYEDYIKDAEKLDLQA